jgi:two-component system chemotaxis response regulator CheB
MGTSTSSGTSSAIDTAMTRPRLVVVGGSAGAFHAFRTIVSGLPDHLPFPVVLVLHQLAGRETRLPRLVAAACRVAVSSCLDKESNVPDTN